MNDPKLSEDVVGSHLEVDVRVAFDTQKRMALGVLIYPFIWLINGIGSGIFLEQPLLFWGALCLFVIVAAIRWLHLRSLKRDDGFSIKRWKSWLIWLLMPHSLLWGGLFAYSLQQPNSMFLMLMTFSTAGLVPGGTDNFAPNLKLGVFFVLSMILPAILVTLSVTHQWAMTLLLLVYMFFILDLAKRQSQAYWGSLNNELVLAKLSRTDALTQLDNRRFFDEKLNELCHLTSRNHEKITVAIVDCDFFKKINDNHGHDVGDQCLKHLATLLTKCLPRTTDICARFGGEEFSLILPGTDVEGARLVMERIRQRIESTPLKLADINLSMTVSIGSVSRVVKNYETNLPTQLFKEADKALYRAKETGRNRCVFCVYDEASKDYLILDS